MRAPLVRLPPQQVSGTTQTLRFFRGAVQDCWRYFVSHGVWVGIRDTRYF